MSTSTPFDIIDQYCQKQKKSQLVRDLAYSIYRQQFESLTSGPTPDPTAISATQTTLLSPGSLAAHVRSAEELLRKEIDTEIAPLRRKDSRDSFWFAVFTGIVGNVIYSILLIVLFIVAKDQLSSWLASLVQSKP